MGIGLAGYAQPNIPKENISSDIPADVRKEIEGLYSSDPGKRVRAAINLGEMGEWAAPGIPYLVGMLGDTSQAKLRDGGSTTPGKAAAEALLKIGKPAIEPLATASKYKYLEILGNAVVDKSGFDKYAMRFGVNGEMYPDIHQGETEIYAVTKELDKLGMVWLRHPGRGGAWFEIQPTKDTWDFRKLDAVISANEHPWIIEILPKGKAYPFKADFSRQYLESLGGERGIMEYMKANTVDMNDPEQKADAELYVKTFVNRYKNKIKCWGGDEGIVDPHAFDIMKNTYTWIKEVDPDAVVLITAVAGDDDRMYNKHLEAFDSLLAKGIADYFDVANIHYYGKIEGDFEERLEQRFDEYKAIMDKYGVKKPIWVTETSTSSYEKSVLSGPSSEQTQARHVVKRLVIFSAKGAEKVLWHNYRATFKNNKFYQCNLVDPETNTPKPSYYTFKLMVDKLGYYKTVETLRRDNVRLYKFTTHTNKPIFVAWSTSSQTIDLSKHLEAEKVLITHIIEDNSVQPKTETTKTTNINISASPIFIEFIE